jgi:hypothetical protein
VNEKNNTNDAGKTKNERFIHNRTAEKTRKLDFSNKISRHCRVFLNN